MYGVTKHNSESASGLESNSADRLKNIRYLNQLPESQFEELLYALNPPSGVVPGKSAPQGDRVSSLLAWHTTVACFSTSCIVIHL